MPKKILGRAQFTAHRIGGITHLTAVGITPNLNDKVDFEELPFLINPPMYGFYFIKPDVSLPALKPFKYEEPIVYPTSAQIVRIQDADGIHSITIASVEPRQENQTSSQASDATYCVFQLVGGSTLMVARCDAILPAVYARVFGPASREQCEEYVSNHRG